MVYNASHFPTLTCTFAVGNAAQNYSDMAQCVCQKKRAFLFGVVTTGGPTVFEAKGKD